MAKERCNLTPEELELLLSAQPSELAGLIAAIPETAVLHEFATDLMALGNKGKGVAHELIDVSHEVWKNRT